jgi:hypothetical protein
MPYLQNWPWRRFEERKICPTVPSGSSNRSICGSSLSIRNHQVFNLHNQKKVNVTGNGQFLIIDFNREEKEEARNPRKSRIWKSRPPDLTQGNIFFSPISFSGISIGAVLAFFSVVYCFLVN